MPIVHGQPSAVTYSDSRGRKVTFPLGDASFADEVVETVSGKPVARDARWSDASLALGPPNYVNNQNAERKSPSISSDGQAWTVVGTIRGGTAEVDIAKAAAPGVSYRYVRLVDLKVACGGPWPGADVDAVGAIGSALALA